MSATDRSTSPTQPSALGKIVAVVEVVAHESRLTRIASETGLPVSTVHRILQELVDVGWVTANNEHGYVLSSRLLAIGARASQGVRLLRVADPILRELRDATGQTVHLAVRHLDEMAYVAKLDGLHAYQMRSHVGLTIPMHCTAVGKAVLAGLPRDEVISIAERTGLPRRTRRTITDVDQLLKHLEKVRRDGFAYDNEENEARVRCIGAPVIGSGGNPAAGVSVSSLDVDLDGTNMHRYAKRVVATARELSLAIGAPIQGGAK